MMLSKYAPKIVPAASRTFNFVRLLGKGKTKHFHHIVQARHVLDRLAEIRAAGAVEPQILAYLRKVDPTTFEELILEMAERAGCFVTRNTRYTGDGGIDGRFSTMDGFKARQRWIVQAKRYQDAINPQHVHEFADLVNGAQARGLFVHTGRTGNMSRTASRRADLVILSGFQLALVAAGERSFQALLDESTD